jgi:hypothetical protein
LYFYVVLKIAQTPVKGASSHPISDTVQDISKRESEYRVAQEARLKSQEDKIRLEKTLRMEQEIRTASESAKSRLERGIHLVTMTT